MAHHSRSTGSSPLPAGELLMGGDPPPSPSPTLKKLKPAGKVLVEKKWKRTHVIRQPSREELKLSKDGASDAVKYFFKDLIPEVEVDVVDTGPINNNNNSVPHRTSPLKNRFADPVKLMLNKEFYYDMNHEFRGCFMIFNYKNYHPKMGLSVRKGTDKDAENLKNMAKNLGFEFIRVFPDCTVQETKDWIEHIACNDHSYYDCFACAILTHGDDDDVLYAYDGKMRLKDFTTPFESQKCKSLAGKPKMFFIQACRGHKLDSGVERSNSDKLDNGYDDVDAVDASLPVIIPSQADFLIAHSTAKEYFSWRNESNGSVFVQALCSTFNVFHHKKDILQMLTNVNCMVAYEWQSSSSNKRMNKKKQIPSITTQLTAIVQFCPKNLPLLQQCKTFESTTEEVSTVDEGDHVSHSRRTQVQRQTSTISTTITNDENEIEPFQATTIRDHFYPKPPDSPRPNQLPLQLSPPAPNISLTEATPTALRPGTSGSFRKKRSSFSSPLDFEKDEDDEEEQRRSFPQCHTHMRPSDRGYVMETHFD